jgi:O-acetyl-ADP-ribose deacetylase (regulator of RNase III)
MIIDKYNEDLFYAGVDALVNPVNCVGVMGKGLALQFKKMYPGNFEEYKKACSLNKVVPGELFVWISDDLFDDVIIINFPTKRHWRDNSVLRDIEDGLTSLVKIIKSMKINSIAIPPLGCGLGGLDWNIVRNKIIEYLDVIPDLDIHIYNP